MIDVIDGVIIAVSFTQIDTLFIPISKLTESHARIDAFGAFFAYFVIITGWIGYHRSISDRPHRGIFGNLRFSLELLIAFLSYYLVIIAIPRIDSKGMPVVNYSDTFVWILPVMFSIFVLWDILKNIEYRSEIQTRKIRIVRASYSLIFFGVFIMMSLAYSHYILSLNSLEKWGNKNLYDFYFMVIGFVSIAIYRIWLKWPIIHHIRRRKQFLKDEALDRFI